MRRIYLASSWKNARRVRELAFTFRKFGHEVFDFTDAVNRPKGLDNYVFGPPQWDAAGKSRDNMEYKDFLKWDLTQRAFASDKAGIDWSNTLVLVLPSGRSSHLEAGYAVGQGKDFFVYGNLPLGEFDAMYGFANGTFHEDELDLLIQALRKNPGWRVASQ